MAWEAAYEHVAEALDLLDRAPRATVLNINVPAPQGEASRGRSAGRSSTGSARSGSPSPSGATRRCSSSTGRAAAGPLDPESDTALVDGGVATVTALDAIRAVPPDELPFAEPPPTPEPRLAPGPGEARPRG